MLNEILSTGTSVPTLMAWGNAALLGASGLVNVAAPAPVRRAYARWDISVPSIVVVGALQLLAAGLLLIPELRIWGIALASLITFGTVVLLLDRGRYVVALPVVLFMIALAGAAFSLPSWRAPIHYMAALPAITHAFS
jgi:hypothetical protein